MKIKNNLIQFNKLKIENLILKYEIGFIKSENKRLKNKIKRYKKSTN
jgi:hypothetical protein